MSKSGTKWVYLLGVVVAIAVGAGTWKALQPPPDPQQIEQEFRAGWKFYAMRDGADPGAPADASLVVHAGDTLVAYGPITDHNIQFFLQDRAQFEVETSEPTTGDLEGQPVRMGGIKLAAGKGEVRLVVVATSNGIEELPVRLKASNRGKDVAEARLINLQTALRANEAYRDAIVLASSWYRLEPPDPADSEGETPTSTPIASGGTDTVLNAAPLVMPAAAAPAADSTAAP
jgi:hypothetical protein